MDTCGWGEGWGRGTGHTHADGPRRNTLTALLCSSVCWGHRWDLVGHKVALYIPNCRPPTEHSFTHRPACREGWRWDGLLRTQSVTNKMAQSSNEVLKKVMKCQGLVTESVLHGLNKNIYIVIVVSEIYADLFILEKQTRQSLVQIFKAMEYNDLPPVCPSLSWHTWSLP